MEKKTRIIYIKPANSSFIRGDQQIFEKQYEVKAFLMDQNINKLVYGWKLTLLFFYLLAMMFRNDTKEEVCSIDAPEEPVMH